MKICHFFRQNRQNFENLEKIKICFQILGPNIKYYVLTKNQLSQAFYERVILKKSKHFSANFKIFLLLSVMIFQENYSKSSFFWRKVCRLWLHKKYSLILLNFDFFLPRSYKKLPIKCKIEEKLAISAIRLSPYLLNGLQLGCKCAHFGN